MPIRRSKLYYWRKLHDMQPADIAEALGVHRVTVHHLESGRKRPSEDLALKIAVLTGIPAEDILADYESTKGEVA